MRWQNKRRSQHIEDRRRFGTKAKTAGAGGLIIAAIMAFLLKDPSHFFNALTQQATSSVSSQTRAPNREEEQVADFTSVVLANLEDTWTQLFNQAGIRFRSPKLVLYSQQIKSACGFNTAASGPFYCPGDEKIYLDLTFLNELKKMGASGDFAFAYVIAHEYGHHISKMIGSLPKVNNARRQLSKREGNQLSILLELQADCFAGIWANVASNKYHMLERGDAQEGLQAAASVGDDKLIGNRPDMFTHGTSRQRMQWLQQGMQTGNVAACDTFKNAGIRL